MKQIIILILLHSLLFSLAEAQYQLQVKDEYASCTDYEIIDNQSRVSDVPHSVKQGLKCPMILDLHKGCLTYIHQNTVMQYHIESRREQKLFLNYPDIDGISGPLRSPDENLWAFVIINQAQKYGYKSFCRIIVLSLDEEGQVEKKQKFDKPINFHCAASCYVALGTDLQFKDNETLIYKKHQQLTRGKKEFCEIKL